ncbi:cytochrome P450 [Leifsonia sp. H3M29-4]|uniref:cytochrome P450 n=1 Tax=Salinibacterium metalliresistens TaxID=3031321 RepID=UPI0023DBFD65|nr:cytochrome P450 [Salinibacterium metalliresistens]MDF1478030.1 cytochrome P450 [Salinibacterium metalliresistens]
MPVAEDKTAPRRERVLNPLTDGIGSSAKAHEHRLLSAARPALPYLNWLGTLARPIMRVPGLGWITADPLTARAVLNDPDHFTLLSEGGVGHLWAQILGDWVYELFDGPGHYDLRTRSRELFTEKTSFDFVEKAWGSRIEDARLRFDAGEAIDLADLSRMLVGQMVVALLGMPVPDTDAAYREIFATGEELASTALGTTADTVLPPHKIARAREIVERLTGHIDAAFESAPTDTIIGRCRELGLSLRETKGLSTLLMVAGTETAASAMARTAALLYDTGEQHRLIEHPDYLESAVREALRVTSPAPIIGRSVLADLEIGGRSLKAGERIIVLTWTANNLAGEYRVDRAYIPQNRQLWFGAGRHLCLGGPLARAELGKIVQLLIGDGRPFRVVSRRYGRRVLIPAYESLVVQKA